MHSLLIKDPSHQIFHPICQKIPGSGTLGEDLSMTQNLHHWAHYMNFHFAREKKDNWEVIPTNICRETTSEMSFPPPRKGENNPVLKCA